MKPDRERAELQGLLVSLAPMALLPPIHPAAPPLGGVWTWAPHLGVMLAALLAAWLLGPSPRLGRWLATAAVVGGGLATVVGTRLEPLSAFPVVLALAALVVRIWPVPVRGRSRAGHREFRRAAARAAAWVGVGAWFVGVGWEWARDPGVALVLAVALAIAAVAGRRWSAIADDAAAESVTWWAAGAGSIGALTLLTGLAPGLALSLLAVPSVALLVASRSRREVALTVGIERILEHPARTLVATFVLLCLAGAVGLAFPIANTQPGVARIPAIDALFTSVSATCVTGLGVLDTPTAFSGWGQLLILVLIQVGGLGIMTFSTAAFFLLGRRMSLRHEATAAGLVGASGRQTLQQSLRLLLAVTAVSEAGGAVALTLLFRAAGDGWGMALWRGVFTSISAFCNAGFALQSDSLIPYQRDPWVLLTVSVLIIVGGLGPVVVLAVPDWVRGRRTTLHVRMVLVTTAILLGLSTVTYAALEWNRSLHGLGLVHGLGNAWFMAVTLRTAGFNSVDLTVVHPATLMFMIGMMFIGGSPGSTAGGAKTTTVAVLALSVVAAMRGRPEVTVGGRRIPHETVYKAAAIGTVAVLLLGGLLFGLLLTQDLEFGMALFEAASALGTVGLTVGATPRLDEVGKVIVIVAMFLGRVGPLTLFLLLVERRAERQVGLPEEEIAVG